MPERCGKLAIIDAMSGPALRSASKSLSADDEVFDLAARTFRVMSAPMRLKIISSLCEGEKSVTQLLDAIQTTQPNMSQHLASLYRGTDWPDAGTCWVAWSEWHRGVESHFFPLRTGN